MSSSMDNNTKKPKKLGPIRTGAVVPVTVIFVLSYLYFAFMFDAHLRRGIEWVGTMVNGAEVNVADVRTSFWGGSFALHGLQVTDKSKPAQNIVQIGRIHFQFMWDALLRAKFVVDDASIENIQALVPRKSPGYVVPPSPPSKGPSALEEIEDGVIDQTKSQFNNNVLGDVATVLEGTDPEAQLKNIQAQLKSDVRIKELEKELKEKEKLWKERLENLPQAKEFEELAERAKKLNFKSKNPLEVAAAIKDADKIIKEADAKIKYFEKTSKALKGDVNTFQDTVKELEKLAQEDLKDLQTRLKIPNLDVGEFSAGLFARMFQTKLASIRKYMEVGRQYMPPEKSAEEKQAEIIPPQRGEGKNYKFPITKGYPLFWLKHAKISSEPSASEYSGSLSGEIKDVTSDPVYLGRPTLAFFEGDFPKQQIMDVKAKITIDHTTQRPYEKLEAQVGSYPLSKLTLSDSKDVQLAINKAEGGLALTALLKDQALEVVAVNNFKNIGFDLDAKSRTVKEILGNVLSGIPMVTVEAKARGSWTNISMSIDSNLGRELANGFKQQLNAKVEQAKAKLKSFIDDRIKGEKAKLNAEFEKVKGQISGQIDGKKKELDQAKKQTEQKVSSEQGGKSNPAEKAGKKAIKDLKKKFGF